MNYNKGFTLVEMAIAITIIAAILAAVTGGIALKKQAELRGVITEMEGHRDSFQRFVEVYQAVPGDFNGADGLWAGDCAITITCNGDGNGAINAYRASNTNETARAWKHMQRAGVMSYLVEQVPAAYTGVLNYDIAPQSQYWDAGYYIAVGTDIGGDFGAITSPFDAVSSITHALFSGRPASVGGFTVAAFSSKDAYSIDVKMDDAGIDSAGLVNGASTGVFRVTTAQNGGANCLSGGRYIVTNDTPACLIGYQLDNR